VVDGGVEGVEAFFEFDVFDGDFDGGAS